MANEISFFNKSFWDLWLQKMFRNISSAKYQFMVAMFIIITFGMFTVNEVTKSPWITAIAGLGFLAGGFITFATSRIYMNTKLKDDASYSADR